MQMDEKKCKICGTYTGWGEEHCSEYCPVCIISNYNFTEKYRNKGLNLNHLASYLIYNGFENGYFSSRRITSDSSTIENWYPKTFNEKIDKILLFFNSRIRHMGQTVCFGLFELAAALFIDKLDFHGELRCESNKEVEYMLEYLKTTLLIKCSIVGGTNSLDKMKNYADITILPDGYKRIDELQKHNSNGRNVLVAMKFGDDTKQLREAIRKGVLDAGYIAIFIDEVQHNDLITPELLKHIRDSKFVVVDLTHQNNGAYFEEGYAMGLGKIAIQLCRNDVKLHFDVAQKNTIMWGKEEDIPQLLTNRIKATIE